MSAFAWQGFARIAADRADAVAIVQGDRAVTFAQLHAMALCCAGALGVAPGDRVLLSGPDCPEFAAAVLGAWRRGAIPALLHPDAPGHHFDHARRTIAPAAEAIGAEAFAALCAGATMVDGALPVQSPDYPASILFTSGSTGAPKAVTQSAANLTSGVARVAASLGYGPAERIGCGVPFSFDYGWGQLLSCLLGGHALVLPDKPGGFGMTEAIVRHRPTVLAAVPSLLGELLMGFAPAAEADCTAIRLITNTGSKIAPALFDAVRAKFPDTAIALNYGLTETYRSASLPVDEADSHRDSVGHAIPGVDLVVLREDGTIAAPGEEGEIVHRGAGVFLGYWGDPQATARARRPDPLWLAAEEASGLAAPPVVFTGDLGHKDDAGRLYIHGRRDGQIKSMGVRVSRDEIEKLLGEAAEVAAAAVITRGHPVAGELIVACIEWHAGVDAAAALRALKQAMRAKASKYMEPREWRALDRLPRTTSGKIDYPALRAAFGGDAG